MRVASRSCCCHTAPLQSSDAGPVAGLTEHSPTGLMRRHAPMRVAVAEDDPGERKLLSEWLREAGHQCYAFDRGETLLRVGTLDGFDALVVGNLRATSGVEVLAHIRRRETRWVPILFVGDGRCESDVVAALRQGADDYMTKPIRRLELVARLQAVARRSRLRSELRPPLEVDVFSIDLQSRIVRRHSRPVALTAKDFDVAVLFLSSIGRLLSRRQIQECVWGTAGAVPSRTLDTHVCRVRNKLKLTPDEGWQLSAVYKFGYRLTQLNSSNADERVRCDIAAQGHLNVRLVRIAGGGRPAGAVTSGTDGGAEASPVL